MSRERLLVLIDEHPEGIRQKDLATEEGINASSTSEVVNRLEEDGYVIRTVDESDRRATLLHLTELGKARAAEIRDEKEAVLEELFSPLSPSEKETLAELLDKLNNR
jgi:DNA-binding MarR family transcriptional regulator